MWEAVRDLGAPCIAKGHRLQTNGVQVSEGSLSSLEGIKCTKELGPINSCHLAFMGVTWAVVNTYLIYWVAYNKKKYISHSSAGWKSNIRVPAWLGSGESLLPHSLMNVFSLCPYVVEWKWVSGVSSIMALIPLMRTLPSWPNYLPKALLPNMSHWVLGFQYMNFGGANIQSTTMTFSQNPDLSLSWKIWKTIRHIFLNILPSTNTPLQAYGTWGFRHKWGHLIRAYIDALHFPSFLPPLIQIKGLFVQAPDWLAILLNMSTVTVKFQSIHWNWLWVSPHWGKCCPVH